MRDMVVPTVGEHQLGPILVESDTLLVTDPSYIESAPHCYVFVGPCQRGEWQTRTVVVNTGVWGDRVQLLEAKHSEPDHWVELEAVAGVDSGQMSIMDKAHMPRWEEREDGDPFSFMNEINRNGPFSYDGASFATLYKGTGGGVIGHQGSCGLGVASSSGLGDGAYEIRVGYVGDIVVAVQVWFIQEDELVELREIT